MLLGAQAVDRKLESARVLGRPAQLVIDDAERSILEEIDSIRLGANADRLRPLRALEFECALQGMLEQTLEDRHFLFDLEVEGTLAETGRDRGPEEIVYVRARGPPRADARASTRRLTRRVRAHRRASRR